jgi:hypothetical protein
MKMKTTTLVIISCGLLSTGWLEQTNAAEKALYRGKLPKEDVK